MLTACEKSGSGNAKEDAGEKAEQKQESAAEKTEKLNKRCDALGQGCGEKEKNKEKITEECKEAAKKQVEKGCADKVVAAYDCYEKEICEKIEKIWVLDDFRVLTERHEKCVEERKAGHECVTGSDKDEK